ncbi:unnamed protein product [Toxocara canis]|uniref:Transmembrane protein n=1 Tax=Toxocara canis TaxID=6265 RepID=A0A183V9V2_TOXCA|nr:unnamed protein product [Toxocara canis]
MTGLLNFLVLLCYVPSISSLETKIVWILLVVSATIHFIGIILWRPSYLIPDILLKILTATLLSTKYFYLDEHLTPDYAIFTSWITVTVVWFICEATLFTTGCFQMIRNGRPTDDTDAPPKYEEVMSMRMKQEKMQLPNYENCLRVVRNDKTPCVIDISKVEEMLHGIQDSHPASTEGTLKNDSSI